MTLRNVFGSAAAGWAAVAAGIAIGAVYVLSPLTVWFAVAAVLLVRWATTGLASQERRWVGMVLVIAIALRVLAIVMLFVMTDHARVPFGRFFGDEEYFIKRSLFLRNIALGIPMHGGDLVDAFDEYGETSYLRLAAFVQILVGPAPYGLHLFGIACYLAAVVALYRLVRDAFGRTPAFCGLVTLLALPSLFAWSISALKEPLFFMLTALSVRCAIATAWPGTWRWRAWNLAALTLLVIAVETVRRGGGALSAASILLGLTLAGLLRRPRLLLAAVIAVPIVVGAVYNRPAVQFRTYALIQKAAGQHWGHVATAGYTYKLLDDRFYPDRAELYDMQFGEMMRFVVRAIERYVTVPWPWEVQSRPALAYLPEQTIWYLLVALAPFGVARAFRRNALVAAILLAHLALAAASVAMTSGNVGTLVRHRGLALPYLVWFSAVAACDLIARRATDSRDHAVSLLPTAEPA